MKTTTTASRMTAADSKSLKAAEVTQATDTTGGAATPAKAPKRRMARESQAGAGATAIESKPNDGNQAPSPAPRATSKIASVIALLERTEGATLAEMIGATGWLPHWSARVQARREQSEPASGGGRGSRERFR